MAAMPDGPRIDAGKNFRADAPARSARKASVGENTPGIVTIAAARAIASTSTSTFGLTIRRPPTSATRAHRSR